MMSYWINFATRNDPNGPGLPVWPRFGASGVVLSFGTEIAPIANPQESKFRFLARFRKNGVLPASWRAE
jgi:para-nitrobenzyl esterase